MATEQKERKHGWLPSKRLLFSVSRGLIVFALLTLAFVAAAWIEREAVGLLERINGKSYPRWLTQAIDYFGYVGFGILQLLSALLGLKDFQTVFIEETGGVRFLFTGWFGAKPNDETRNAPPDPNVPPKGNG